VHVGVPSDSVAVQNAGFSLLCYALLKVSLLAKAVLPAVSSMLAPVILKRLLMFYPLKAWLLSGMKEQAGGVVSIRGLGSGEQNSDRLGSTPSSCLDG
jgi:hypothetical protein